MGDILLGSFGLDWVGVTIMEKLLSFERFLLLLMCVCVVYFVQKQMCWLAVSLVLELCSPLLHLLLM